MQLIRLKKNNMRNILIISLLILSGCGKGPNKIDPAFQPLYNSFIAEANKNGVSLEVNQGITIQFASLDTVADPLGEVIGECDDIGWGGGNIQIDSIFWNNTIPTIQKILLFHEL